MKKTTSNITISKHQYGKAENRVVRIHRKSDEHTIADINVSTCLHGNFEQAYLSGDQSNILPTDTQKQTAFIIAKTQGINAIEEYGLTLAKHFVTTIDPVEAARIEIEHYEWERAVCDGQPHPHTWVGKRQETRLAKITYSPKATYIIGGLKNLTLLKSTGSQFHGFLKDEYTILEPTYDRVMATSLTAQWRFISTDVDWNSAYADIKAHIISVYAKHESLAVQHTLYEIARELLENFPQIVEVRLSAPNKHYFLYDIERFGLENNNEVYIASDRPYGLIHVAVIRTGEPECDTAWEEYHNWL